MSSNYREISLGFTDEKFKEGFHIVYIYNDDWERKKTMGKFLQQGVLEKEKVLYLVDDISPEEMKKELLHLGINVEETQKDFEINTAHYTHCPDCYFSPQFMLEYIAKYYDEAIKDGYAGARGAGEMSWALIESRANIPDLLWYEAELNHVLESHPLTSICQYDARRFDGAVIMDILSVHPMMIVRGQLVKNPNYVEADIFLSEYNARIKRNSNTSEDG